MHAEAPCDTCFAGNTHPVCESYVGNADPGCDFEMPWKLASPDGTTSWHPQTVTGLAFGSVECHARDPDQLAV